MISERPPRPTTVPSRGTGKVTSSSGWSVPPSARWSSEPRDSPCSSTFPAKEGYRHKHTPKNGPALAGYGAITMKNALAATMTTLPEQLRRSLTWDRGKELSAARSIQGRDRHPGLLRRSAESLATRQQREHQRAACVSTSQRALISRGGTQRRSTRSPPCPQQSTPQDPRLEDSRRSLNEHLLLPNKPVLRRSIEPGQYTSRDFAELARSQRRRPLGRPQGRMLG